MKKVIAFLLLSGCGATFQMPAPVAYPGACPEDDYKCQRNADAQTLAYIGEHKAATRLMSADPSLAPHIGAGCEVLPVVY